MARKDRETRRVRRERAGSTERDAKHSAGLGWSTLAIPDGLTVFKPKVGMVRFDIVPYQVGEGNPYAEKGKWYYERTFYRHNSVGPNNEAYVCPSATVGAPCPICEYAATVASDRDELDKDLAKMLNRKQRQIFLISMKEDDDDDREILLYETSYFTFGKKLDDERKGADEDEDYKRQFDDQEGGATLKVTYEQVKAKFGLYTDAVTIGFKPRPNGLPDSLLDHGYCLDDIVKVLSYDELKAIFEGRVGGGDKESGSDTNTTPQWEHGDKVEHRRFGTCKVKRVEEDGSLWLMDEDDETHKNVDPDSVRQARKSEPKPESKSEPEPEPVAPTSNATGNDDWADLDGTE